jgi:hypothetical protein
MKLNVRKNKMCICINLKTLTEVYYCNVSVNGIKQIICDEANINICFRSYQKIVSSNLYYWYMLGNIFFNVLLVVKHKFRICEMINHRKMKSMLKGKGAIGPGENHLYQEN